MHPKHKQIVKPKFKRPHKMKNRYTSVKRQIEKNKESENNLKKMQLGKKTFWNVQE